MSYKENSILINKKKFKCVIQGEGPLVLLVHGWPETWVSWKRQISLISKLGFMVCAFNTRGYGGSLCPKNISDYSLKFFMEDILDIISFLKKDKAILIGHDWGAPICWTTAAYYKNKVSGVIGLSVPFTRRGKISSTKLWKKLYKNIFFYQNYFQKLDIAENELEKNISISLQKIYYWCSAEGYKDQIKTSKDINSGLLDKIPLPNGRLKWLKNNNLKSMVLDFQESGFKGPLNRYRAQDIDWRELTELEKLSIIPPSLFIGGEYDPVRRFIKDYDAYKNAGKYCKNFRGSHIINDAGHWVQQEKPNEVNKIIKNFLKNLKN
ncbi:MAG: epoxide hydrolase [Pelagibacterales bacterium]|nr:epoxide hydrolase [Pelagibacterales bacterium]|tara:strand:+ start:5267 stop:6232 length:966 start_codon:yes stop_codon:yes gene_type:complete